jgi:hypothetical protein
MRGVPKPGVRTSERIDNIKETLLSNEDDIEIKMIQGISQSG